MFVGKTSTLLWCSMSFLLIVSLWLVTLVEVIFYLGVVEESYGRGSRAAW